MDDSDQENEEFIRELFPKIVSREEWGAKESRRRKALKTPVETIVFTTTNTRRCFTKAHCKHNLRVYQKSSLESYRNDIPYNFLIGNDGRVYEGMGWNYQADCSLTSWIPFFSNPMKELYETCLHVAFMRFKKTKPTPKQIKAAFGLMLYGITNNILKDNVNILETNVRGPLFPKEEIIKEDFDEAKGADGDGEISDERALAIINENLDDDDKITLEQMKEEMKDIEKKFKDFDEKLKNECQAYIEKNYPWHFKTNTKNNI